MDNRCAQIIPPHGPSKPDQVANGGSAAGRRAFSGQSAANDVNRSFQFGQVVIYGGLKNGVRGVEVAMGKVVTHTRDLLPGDRRLSGKQVIRERLDGLADL